MPHTTSPADHGMFFVLLPTLDCNLDCDYCFEEHPPLRWELKDAVRVLEEIFYLLEKKSIRSCKLHWQGGEPLLLGPEFWKTIFPLAQEMAERSNVALSQSMQTNLTLYQSDYAPLVHTYLRGVLGTSFELSDHRCRRGGDAETFRSDWKHAYGKAITDGLDVGVLCLLDEETIRLGFREYTQNLRETYGINAVRFTFPFSPPWARDLGFWLDPDSAGRFISDGFRAWHASGGDDWMVIRPFGYLLARFLGETSEQSGLCVFSKNCADTAISILPDGDVVLCDNFAHRKSGLSYGNIFRQSLADIYDREKRQRMKDRVYSLLNEECASCRYLLFCNGGCLVRSRYDEISGILGDHYCTAYKQLFQAVEEVILEL